MIPFNFTDRPIPHINHNSPRVFITQTPRPNIAGILGYLDHIGASRDTLDLWAEKLINSADPASDLVEFAGRLCYKSFEVGLNPNIKRIRTDQAEYINNLIRSAHGSVLSHVSVSMIVHNVSRVVTHELVRNAVGSAYSQESMRYVRVDPENMRWPQDFDLLLTEKQLTAVKDLWEDYGAAISEFIQSGEHILDLNNPELSFETKKRLSSALRTLYPSGILTEIFCTFNFRALRWIVEQRSAPGAETEMRTVAGAIYEAVKQACPTLLLHDFVEVTDKDGLISYQPTYHKI